MTDGDAGDTSGQCGEGAARRAVPSVEELRMQQELEKQRIINRMIELNDQAMSRVDRGIVRREPSLVPEQSMQPELLKACDERLQTLGMRSVRDGVSLVQSMYGAPPRMPQTQLSQMMYTPTPHYLYAPVVSPQLPQSPSPQEPRPPMPLAAHSMYQNVLMHQQLQQLQQLQQVQQPQQWQQQQQHEKPHTDEITLPEAFRERGNGNLSEILDALDRSVQTTRKTRKLREELPRKEAEQTIQEKEPKTDTQATLPVEGVGVVPMHSPAADSGNAGNHDIGKLAATVRIALRERMKIRGPDCESSYRDLCSDIYEYVQKNGGLTCTPTMGTAFGDDATCGACTLKENVEACLDVAIGIGLIKRVGTNVVVVSDR